MSRHRNLRKVSLGDDDYDDEITQSYDEKYAYAISPSTSEMYMFNRNNQSQNISQFIKGQILEENNDDIMNEFSNLKDEDKQLNKNESISSPDTNDPQKSLKSKMDDDFMFQMDKEPNFRQQTSAQKPKDDLCSLLNETAKLFDCASINSKLMNKEDEEEEESEKGLFDFDLNTLAERYNQNQNQDNQKQISFCFDTKIMCENKENNLNLSSSIDNLIDSFFSKNDSGGIVSQTLEMSVDQINENLTRTKSICINSKLSIEDDNQKKISNEQLSLSDLANEYLANMTPSSVENQILSPLDKSPHGTSLLDLIDYDFKQRLNLKGEILNTEANLIHLNNRNLIISKSDDDKKNLSKLSSSLTSSSNLSMSNASPSSLKLYKCSHETIGRLSNKAVFNPKLEIIFSRNELNDAYSNVNDLILDSLFCTSNYSTFGELFSQYIHNSSEKEHMPFTQNSTNKLFEAEFNYTNQKNNFKKSVGVNKKRVLIDLTQIKYEKTKGKRANTSDSNSGISSSASIQKSKSMKTSSSSKNNNIKSKLNSKSTSKENKPIQLFDFSIPSPDDIVIAKQKFAFKNIRFK